MNSVDTEVHIKDMGFSTRTFNALNCAGVHTSSVIAEMTDFQLQGIYKFGAKGIVEIDRKVPGRIKVREGEKETYYLNARARKYIRCLERGFDFTKTCKYCYVSKDRATAAVVSYCAGNLDRINEVMKMLSEVQGTSELVYLHLQQMKFNMCN